eukprot:TRINITY_DN77818_c0_g1_i1.p1 TRINITY_DN77818_c0_g1~~TRINITY_DN77818_c0_g1_i1.p1  ORF type:complete len:182 (+),score=14.21 TRINITY_DN77818_c0_g1_i1:20-565(+)
MKMLLLLLALPLALGNLNDYSCGCYQNTYDSNVYGLMCSTEYVPRSVAIKQYRFVGSWRVLDCRDCERTGFETCFNNTSTHRFRGYRSQNTGIFRPGQTSSYRKSQSTGLIGGQQYKCCAYGDPHYHYAEDSSIHTVNRNYQGGSDLESTCGSVDDGQEFMGEWSTSSLYNQCFFVTDTKP